MLFLGVCCFVSLCPQSWRVIMAFKNIYSSRIVVVVQTFTILSNTRQLVHTRFEDLALQSEGFKLFPFALFLSLLPFCYKSKFPVSIGSMNDPQGWDTLGHSYLNSNPNWMPNPYFNLTILLTLIIPLTVLARWIIQPWRVTRKIGRWCPQLTGNWGLGDQQLLSPGLIYPCKTLPGKVCESLQVSIYVLFRR